MIEKIFLIDFPNQRVADIFGTRYFNTAKILGLEYRYSIAEFGENKFHFKIAVKGDKKSIKNFTNFVNESSKLEKDISIKQKNSNIISEHTFTAEEVKNMVEPMMQMCRNWQKINHSLQQFNEKMIKDWKKARTTNIIVWLTMIGTMFYLVFVA